MNNESFDKLVKKASPDSPIALDCLKAFVVGGLICVLGEFLSEMYMKMGLDKETASSWVSVSLVFLSSLLTGLGLYSKLGKFAGAGSFVPITGFSNAVTAPAIEFKKEGYILGVGSKIFLLAGPVILFGTLTSCVVGIIYWLMN